MRVSLRTDGRTVFFAALMLAITVPVRAETPGPINAVPEGLENVGVDEHLDAQLPLDTPFRNERGQIVRLRDYFKSGVPVILSLNYSDCPMLCNLQLTGLARSLKEQEWTAGREYQVVSISINPKEQPKRALETRQRYLQLYGRSLDGWHFLVGSSNSINRVTDAVGFRYRYLPKQNEYSHPAVAILCTPDGRVSRYLYGIDFPEQTVRLSLVEASEGKIGTPGDQLLLFCFHYDPLTGTYAPRAARLAMTVGAALTIVLLSVGMIWLWSRDVSHMREQASHEQKLPVTAE